MAVKLFKTISFFLEIGIVGFILFSVFFRRNHWNTFIVGLTIWGCIRLFYLIDEKWKFDFPDLYHPIFIVCCLIVFVGGHVFNLYKLAFLYDKIQHLLFPFGLVFLINYMYKKKSRIPLRGRVWSAFFVVVTLICMYEVTEFMADKIADAKMQGVFDKDGNELLSPIDDTMSDLILGMLGALIGCRWIQDLERNHRHHPLIYIVNNNNI